MSSDPNTPDFDSMSPEEMMAWMESLAKRQGADASGFTTAADMEVDEVDPDTVDEEILKREYRPDGWTEERWQAQLAKEEAEKQARLAAQQEQQSAPEPEPEPEPVAEVEPEPEPEPPAEAVGQPAMEADGTPDFDSMSPEEVMAWMETLAKRQGADEGFTTTADMEVAEIDPDTVDESIRNQKYIPDGWTEERWEAHLEKEKADKEARRLAREQQEQQATPEPEPLPEPEPDPIADIVEEDDEQLAFDLPSSMEEETEAIADNNPMSWLESLAETDEDSEELDMPDLSGLGDDLGGLSDLVQEDDDGDPMSWLAGLTGGDAEDDEPELDLEDMSAGLEGLEAFAVGDDDDDDYYDDEDEDDEDESLVSLEDVENTSPENFLESLARLQGAPEDELNSDATTPIPDFLNFDDDDVEDLDEDDIDFDDILEDTQPSEELEPAWDTDDPSSIENPEAWLDALAGAASGSDQIDFDDDDDEDYEEDEELLLEDEDDKATDAIIQALDSGQDVAPEDIQKMFGELFERSDEYAHLDNEPIEEDGDDEEVEEAVAIDMPDWLEELNAGAGAQAVAEDDMDLDVEEEGEDLMADVLAGLDDDDAVEDLPEVFDEVEEAEPVDLPDWLDEDGDVDEDETAEPIDLPDWLSEGAQDDTGDVIADIIADELDVAPGETAILSIGDKQIEVDPNDTWTQAFLMEDREDTAEEWYTERLSKLDVDQAVGEIEAEADDGEDVADEFATVQMTSPPGAVSLEPATFPIEEDLPEGQPEMAPEWLTGVEGEPVTEMPMDFTAMSAEDDDVEMPDWLQDSVDDDIEIPDWLDQAEEDVEEELPDWLKEAGVDDVAEVPDWLTDTVEEPTDYIVAESEPEPEQQQAIQPIQQAQQTQIEAPPAAADVAAAIQSAQEKVANDNLDGALADYEAVVRANDGLDVVVSDLQKLTKNDKHKKNPAIYRVLGDAMMRNGNLQDALDVYRRALNLL